MMTEKSIHFLFCMQASFDKRCEYIKNAGFSEVMIWWSDKTEVEPEYANPQTHPDRLAKYGLGVHNAHADTSFANDIWHSGLAGETAEMRYIKQLDEVSDCGIKTYVLHLTETHTPPPFSEEGFERLTRIFGHAEKRGVRIALENLHKPEYLDYVLPRTVSPYVGFCYDIGHDYIYSPRPHEVLEKYKSRLICLHMHDNDRAGDLHQIPFDGAIDFAPAVKLLREINYSGTLGLEIQNRDPLDQDESRIPAFLVRAGAAADRLLNLQHGAE